MPELPEVESVRLRLSPYVIDKSIESIDIFYDKYNHLKEINGETIIDLKRKGKFLIFIMKNHIMVSHLRMEGKYRIEDNPKKDKHDLVFFHLSNKKTLVYNDVRKFGVFNVFSKDIDIYKVEPLLNVGDEPFNIDKEAFYNNIHKNTGPIKTTLLDQSIMSGLGNIYANEILFLAGINPFRKSNSLSKDETDKLIEASIDILNRAIKAGGTTIRSFESFNGESGHFQGNLLVHEKERCNICNNFIIKEKCGGRGTYYCPSCERSHNYKLYAITGSYASGKSTVLSIIKDIGFTTFSLDSIYNELFETDQKLQKEILKYFKTLDKKEISNIVYNDDEKNELLKNITHKYIFKELFRRIDESDSNAVFVEVPLLFEGSYEKIFDKIIDVYESEKIKDIIISKRNLNNYDIVVRNQLSKEEKKNRSDYIIFNDSTLDDLKKKVLGLIEELK